MQQSVPVSSIFVEVSLPSKRFSRTFTLKGLITHRGAGHYPSNCPYPAVRRRPLPWNGAFRPAKAYLSTETGWNRHVPKDPSGTWVFPLVRNEPIFSRRRFSSLPWETLPCQDYDTRSQWTSDRCTCCSSSYATSIIVTDYSLLIVANLSFNETDKFPNNFPANRSIMNCKYR